MRGVAAGVGMGCGLFSLLRFQGLLGNAGLRPGQTAIDRSDWLRILAISLSAIPFVCRIGNSTTFPEVFQHLPPIVNRNFPPGSSDLSWNPCLFP